jgi:hypothetical protein
MTIYAILDLSSGEYYRDGDEALWVEDFREATVFSSASRATRRMREFFDPFQELVVACAQGRYNDHLAEARQLALRRWRMELRVDALLEAFNEYGQGVLEMHRPRSTPRE